MVFDISELERRHDFDLATQALGSIRCGSLKTEMLSTVAKLLKPPDKDAQVISRRILGMVGRKTIPPLDDAELHEITLADEEIDQITSDEVEEFAREFVAHNDWLLHSYDDESQQENTDEKGTEESNSQYLIRVLGSYLEGQSNRLKRMLAPGLLAPNSFTAHYKKLMEPLSSRSIATSIFNDSTLESLRRNIGISDQLQDTIQAIKHSTISTAINRPSIGPDLISPLPITIPENPLIETNKRLGSMLEQIGEMRFLATKSAELIDSMNKTALQMQNDFMTNARSTQRYALFAVVIAVLSLATSSFFSWLSYNDGKQQSETSNAQINLFQAEIRNLIAAQEKDRIVLVDALNEARQPLPVKQATSIQHSVTNRKKLGSMGKTTP